MKIFLTGGTGYIGSAVRTALLGAGHEVVALVRSNEAAEAIESAGCTPVVGDMRDRDLVVGLAQDADGAIHTAITGDESSADADRELTEAVIAGLGQRNAPFIRTGGVWVHGAGSFDEQTPRDAPSLVAWREAIDLPALAAPGVRSVLIEPGVVYGHGKGIPTLITHAEAVGDPAAIPLLGDGSQHWGTVHVDDLAELYVAALAHADAGSVFLGVNGDSPTVREIGEAASHMRGLEGRVIAEGSEATLARLGAFGEALLLDQLTTGAAARRDLGWSPSRPTLVEEIAAGGYTG